LKLKLADLQSDMELKHKFTSAKLAELFGLLSESKYSNLKDFGKKKFSIFASTYICEQTS
jgi:hypothetical protein